MTDGLLSPQHYFLLAREEGKLDFVALTDHVYHPEPLNQIKWRQLMEMSASFHVPGKFVTFIGFEWTTYDGHFIAIIPGDEPQMFVDNFPKTLDGISAYVDQLGGLMHYAHPGYLDPLGYKINHLTNMPNAEIVGYSDLIFEDEYMKLLAKGLKLGVVGVSDTHLLTHRTGGLTAVWVNECTQEEIMDALRSRRNYASTGERAELIFKADGHWMGEEYTPVTPPVFTIEVKASTPIESISLIKTGVDVLVSYPGGLTGKLEYKDEKWSGEPLLDYIVKVKMKNGHTLWSSPIWTN